METKFALLAAVVLVLSASTVYAMGMGGYGMMGYGYDRQGIAAVYGMMDGYRQGFGSIMGGFWNRLTQRTPYGWSTMGGYGGMGGMMGSYQGGYGYPYGGMMGGYGMGGMMDSGMMGGYGWSTTGYSTCHGWGYAETNQTPINLEEAAGTVDKYLASTPDLKLRHLIEFDNHFYAAIEEKSTGKFAFELLVNKYTGTATFEPGPNMMWNAKYGHMGFGAPESRITEKQALELAQHYLDAALPGTKAEDRAHEFYGYYTVEVMKDGKIYGMLSVHATTGAVWYHTWHGKFISTAEVK